MIPQDIKKEKKIYGYNSQLRIGESEKSTFINASSRSNIYQLPEFEKKKS